MSVPSKLHPVAEIGITFGLMVVFLFQFHIMDNEMDVLPYARAIFDPDWLGSDWYLHLEIPYRFLFSYPVGWSIDTFGWVPTIVAGRLLTYLFIATALYDLRKTILPKASTPIFILPVALFLLLFRTGIGPGEWIVGALDTKVFAYGFAMVSLSRTIRGQWVIAMSAAGLALSFHLLVGGYNLVCIAPLALSRFRDVTWSQKRSIQMIIAFIINGSVGLYAIANQLFFSTSYNGGAAWTFYVEKRVAHHLIPTEFPLTWWILMPLLIGLNAWIYAKSKYGTLSRLALYSLVTAVIAGAGFLIWMIGPTQLLRYYFFRISDGLLPLYSLFVVTLCFANKRPVSDKKWMAGITLVIGIIAIPATFQFFRKSIWDPHEFLYQHCSDREMAEWIKENTSADGVFLTNYNSKYWYMHYERPLFASFKHAPQSAEDLDEWMHRLTLVNGGLGVTDNELESRNFASMSLAEYLEIKRSYPEISFLLLPENKNIALPVLYRTKRFVLYDLRTPKQPWP